MGKDLIRAAQVRAQVSQIQSYQAAVHTFQMKYLALPGDISSRLATRFGFQPRGPNPGQGDGNGIIEGWWSAISGTEGYCPGGEPVRFWIDLSHAGLIDGGFSNATPDTFGWVSGPVELAGFLPAARVGGGASVYVWSGGPGAWYRPGKNGINYYGISAITGFSSFCNVASTPTFAVQTAYNIDRKIDDGLPQSGQVTATYVTGNTGVCWAGRSSSPPCSVGPYTTATPGTSSSCFDNSTSSDGQTAVDGNPQHYSMEIDGGLGGNCALSFEFQ